MNPITMRKAMRGVIAYHRYESSALSKSTLQLNDKFKNPSMLQLEFYTQAVVIVQVTMKLDHTHELIL